MDKFLQTYKIIEAKTADGLSPGTGPPTEPAPPPAKRARTDANIASKDITASLLHKVSLGKNMPELHLRTGPCVYLVASHNEGTKDLPENMFLGGFGAGSFKIEKDDMPDEESQ